MGLFILNEEAAREWLTRLMVASEFGDLAPDCDTALPPETWIDLAWRPYDPGQEDAVSWLIGRAQEQVDVVSHPEGTEVSIGYVDDGDDWCYQLFLTLNSPLLLTLAAPPREMSLLGGDAHSSGIDAAIAVLREATQSGNALVGQLTAFISATIRKKLKTRLGFGEPIILGGTERADPLSEAGP
jgi:hypothetical protein